MRRRSPLAALVALVALGVPAAAPAAVGSAGLGDPFFPLAGNGGYDVRHYAIALDYEPASRRLSGRTVVAATATQELDRFDLDLRSFSVVRVRVHHRAAAFARDGHELVVTPARRLRAGRRFVVSVRYAGTAQAVTDPDGSKEGWAPTSDGAFVVGEPQGAPSWFPANDDPRDKARFDVVVTVPRGNVVMGNGELRRRSDHGGRTTWWWHEGAPMATYLATASNGRFELLRSRGPDGLPILDAIDSGLPADERRRAAQALAREPEILRFLGGLYGPYPFETAGGIVDHAPDVGYALETRTRPSYDGAPAAVSIVHELSHQWVGDSVTPRTWPDIWLNEGFATYTEWLWSEHEGGRTAQQIFNAAYAREGFAWEPAAAALPGASFLFSRPPYDRGAMALHALRVKVGDPVFFRILRDWTAEHAYGTVRTADFTALAERDSGRDLTALFGAWLFRTGRPDSP